MAVLAVERDEQSAPFFDAAARGELLIRHCLSCGHLQAPDSVSCPVCGSADLEWTAASGQGTLISWAVVHGRATPDRPAPTTVVGIVELAEGPWLQVQLQGASPDTTKVGDAVVVAFERPEGSEPIPVFRTV